MSEQITGQGGSDSATADADGTPAAASLQQPDAKLAVPHTTGAPHWVQRLQAPGVIDTGAAQRSYTRHMGWVLQRVGSASSILARYVASDMPSSGDGLPLARLPIAPTTQAAEPDFPTHVTAASMPAAPTVATTTSSMPVASATVVQRTLAAPNASGPVTSTAGEPSVGVQSNPTSPNAVARSAQTPLAPESSFSQHLYHRLAQPGVIKADTLTERARPALTLRTGLHQQLLARSVNQSAASVRHSSAALPLLTRISDAPPPLSVVPATGVTPIMNPTAAAPSALSIANMQLPLLQRARDGQLSLPSSGQQGRHPGTAAATANVSVAAGTPSVPDSSAAPRITAALPTASIVARATQSEDLQTATGSLPLIKLPTPTTAGAKTLGAQLPMSSAPGIATATTHVQRAVELASVGRESILMPIVPARSNVAATVTQRTAAVPTAAVSSASTQLPLASMVSVSTRPTAASGEGTRAMAMASELTVSKTPALTLQRSPEAASTSAPLGVASIAKAGVEPVGGSELVWRKTPGSTTTHRQMTRLSSEVQVMRSMMEGLQSPATATPVGTAGGMSASGSSAATRTAADQHVPSVDVQQIAEAVGRILVRDVEIERERRGVKSWI